ncbi:putative Polycomb group protein ASXL2 isoform X1 [Silurus meridionalis]|uniref:putative Polycomb group protein ASXL2 isoform X1 n=1 Tax=Silurus meridionalis TaxID=175797 RepID=UPI001EEB783E|nr:putative Polycomb group protein ASXL2 isoform X1 [Silurus meridionalis]
MRERQKKKKGRTWAEAAKTVLEKYPNTPMSHKEILQVIQRERLKEIRSGTSPLACLNAMLHTNSRGEEGIFYKVPGRMGVYTLKKDIADVVKELSEEASEDSSDNLSDARNTENNSSGSSKEGSRGRWRRRGPANLQSQPSSPQSRCSSPSVSSSKLISSSQKHSKKALKQALKQQQQRNQRRQCAIPTASSPRLLLKSVKNMTDSAPSKTAWELKQTERCPASPQNSTSSSSSSVKADTCHTVASRKMSQRSSRLNARQLRRTKCEIDVETPDSILVNTNLRAIINKHTFSVLPSDCQQKLLNLLPEVDRQSCIDGMLRITSSALNNEFFTSAAQSWKERLAEGEFTPELRLRMRQEFEKEKKVEYWKEHFFENFYGEQSGLSLEESRELIEDENNSTPAKDSPQPGKTESRTEAQKPNHTDEVIHKELRSREVKTSVAISRPEPESSHADPGMESHSAFNKTSSDTKTASGTQEESTPPAEEVVEPLTSSVEEKVSKGKTNSPTSPQEPSCKGKDTIESESIKAEGVVSQVSEVTSEPLKRKLSSEQEVAEKKPRLADGTAPAPTEAPLPAGTSLTAQQKVPPLKIPVSRILSAPGALGQVSPRTPHPLTPPSIRPGCTGARTLADIKAKAKLAREQRAAAAAGANTAHRGSTSGPSSSGCTSTPSLVQSLSEEFSPASSRSQSVSPIKINSASPVPENTGVLSQTSLSSGATGQVDPSFVQSSSTNQFFSKENKSFLGSQGTQHASNPHVKEHGVVLSVGGMQISPSNMLPFSQKAQEGPSPGPSVIKTSFSIPANNPLVAQLLQGKEVPLEKILPKTPAKINAQHLTAVSQDKGNQAVRTSGMGLEKPVDTQDFSRSRMLHYSNRHGSCVDKLDKNTQEQVLHVLRHRSQQGRISQPSHLEPSLLGYPENSNDQPGFRLGLIGRKRVSKPAMTGHYLLNNSTYGRGSESSKRPHLANLKKENVDGEEKAGRQTSFKGHSSLSGVKVEQQGCRITRPDDPNCPQTNVESQSRSCLSNEEDGGTSTRTKEISPRLHLDISKQGNSGPHHSGDCKPQVTSFQSQRSQDGQETMTGTFYGGTISMSMPHSINHSVADSGASSTVTCGNENTSEGMMSFSVTVTAIPAGRLLDQGKRESSPEQAFIEASGMEDVQSKCYCRLKAMIMCKGCGAFCHDDCIGPSKLCVSCLVVR